MLASIYDPSYDTISHLLEKDAFYMIITS